MKKLIFLFLLIGFASIDAKSQSMFDAWPELKAFHGVMSSTFHPAEEGNLAPIKERSQELALKAEKLQGSVLPKDFDKPAIRTSLKKLAVESRALDKLVSKKPKDEVILKSLTALHDRFHEVVGLCKDEHH